MPYGLKVHAGEHAVPIPTTYGVGQVAWASILRLNRLGGTDSGYVRDDPGAQGD